MCTTPSLPSTTHPILHGWLLEDSQAPLLKPEIYEREQLLQAAATQDIKLSVVDAQQVQPMIESGVVQLDVRGVSVPTPQFVILRIQSTATSYAQAIAHLLEQTGIPCTNTASAMEVAMGKWKSSVILANEGVPVPLSMLIQEETTAEAIEQRLGDYPMMLKVLCGNQGAGVLLVDSRSHLKDLLELKQVLPYPPAMLIQQFISASGGKDLRVFVIDGKSVACVLREAPKGEAKTNFSRGGTVSPFPLTAEIDFLASKTATALGLDVAGIDLLFTEGGYVVCEANASPGWEGMELCHPDLTLAEDILKLATKKVSQFQSMSSQEQSQSSMMSTDLSLKSKEDS